MFVLEPPSVPGIGTGGGLKGYVQDRAARGLPALEGATWALAGAAGQTPGLDPGLHPVQHQDAADLGRDRPHQGRAARRADRQRVPDAVGLHGLGLRQRLQHPGPHLSRDGAGRQSLSPHAARRRQSQDAQRRAARWCRSARSRPSATRPAPIAWRATTSIPRPRCRSRWCAASRRARASRRWRGSPSKVLPSGFGFEWTEIALQEKLAGNTRSWLSAWPCCSCSCCWRRCTRAGCCRSPSS